jgi:hypothetical protein
LQCFQVCYDTSMRKLPITALILLQVMIGLIVATVFCAGWIRASLIPAYVRYHYKPAVIQAYASEFPVINKNLNSYGFVFNPASLRCGIDQEATYVRFSETVPCIEASGVAPFTASSEQRIAWQQGSLEFEQYLLSHGWQKQGFQKQPINKLFDVNGYDGSNAVDYKKPHGNVFCTLSIIYWPDPPHINQVSAAVSCGRDILFFGGSSG